MPASGCFLARDHPEQRRLARAVRSNHTHDPAARKREAHVLHQQLIAIGLPQAAGLDHDVAEPRAGRDVDLDLVDLLGRILPSAGPHTRSGGLCPWPASRAATCGSTPARAARCAAVLSPAFLPARGGSASGRATTSSCPPTECRIRDPAPGSNPPRCPENIDRGSRQRPCLDSPSETARARPRTPRRDGSSARPAAADRATAAGAGTTRRDDVRRPIASARQHRPAAGAKHPSRARPANRGPSHSPPRCGPGLSPVPRGLCPSPPPTGPRRISR